jgi:hypothetical protein
MIAFDEPSLDGDYNIMYGNNSFWEPREIFYYKSNTVGHVVAGNAFEFLNTNDVSLVYKIYERRLF